MMNECYLCARTKEFVELKKCSECGMTLCPSCMEKHEKAHDGKEKR